MRSGSQPSGSAQKFRRRRDDDHVVEPVAVGAAGGAPPRQRLVQPAGHDVLGKVGIQHQFMPAPMREYGKARW
ncbi:hypothetical protein LP419_16150 [Massilia sp. H-1]|nr:hypothetical protein LP419_16150 [Massilia sp. H-1]